MSNEDKAATLALAIRKLGALQDAAEAVDATYQTVLRAGHVTDAEADEVHAMAEWIKSRIEPLISRAKLAMPPAPPADYAQ